MLRRAEAEALLERVTSSLVATVVGDLARGFSWDSPGAVPRRSQSVIPLDSASWPSPERSVAVLIELWWAPDRQGYRRIRLFRGQAADLFEAYLVAGELWRDQLVAKAKAQAVFLRSPDGAIVYQIAERALACSQACGETARKFSATRAERDTTDPPPLHDPRGDARPWQ
ncbi:hypothetical protein [Catenulispora yoronensis]|uniref:hypothetical protein n=1 Tax=Catenulispora yoronensis TaxID=450799 RepID=UPI0031DD4D2E